jgi:F0F1-type ATP synthase assembly protein I
MTTPSKPAHVTTPTSHNRDQASGSAPAGPTSKAAQSTAAIALNMSWQLLVVVVLPVLAGHWLDGHFRQSPVWTVVGLVLSIIGMLVVVRSTIRELNEVMNETKEGKK